MENEQKNSSAYEKGYIRGANAAYGEGRREGYKEGYEKGWNEGYKKGWSEGYKKGNETTRDKISPPPEPPKVTFKGVVRP